MVLPFVYSEEEYKKLEKENKYLKSEIRRITRQRDNLSGIANNLIDENRYLEEENKKLKEEIGKFIMKS